MSARVLVVDDILPNVKLLEAKLMAEYYDVVTATSGEEALEKVASENPDIILLDVMMPGMDGFEVCQHIKSNAATAHIPIVMVTALTDTADRVKGLEAGADDFLCKPVNDVALMARVRSLVRLKMTIDEWRAREVTATSFGVMSENTDEMSQRVDEATILVLDSPGFETDKYVDTLKNDGHTVYVASDGAAALERAAIIDLDLLIVSLNLPDGVDGLRVCSQLRSNERTRSIPILMVGGEDSDMKRIARGLEMGAHDYIIRPIDSNELRARVRTQIRRKRFQEKLRANYEVSLSMALTDTLTGLFNRRYMNVHLEKLLQQTGDARRRISVLLMDIDHFKQVNDTYGHNVGDEVLKIFAERLKTRMRSFDLLARTGGEEFVAALVDVPREKACVIAERLRRAIEKAPMPVSTPEGQIDVRVSIGMAYIGEDVVSIEDALKRADDQLYEAKEHGRNAVHCEGVGRLNPAEYQEDERPSNF